MREPLLTDRRDLTGPFDIVGDVHGCLAELLDLPAHWRAAYWLSLIHI